MSSTAVPDTDGAARHPRPGRARSSILLRVLALLGVACVPLAFIEAGGHLPAVQAVLPVVALLGLLVAALAALCRDLFATVLALVATLALLVPVLPLAPRPTVPAADTHGSDLVVLTLNTEFGQADPGAVVSEVRHRRPDVLVLLEETPEHWRALAGHGLTDLLPHATGVTTTGAAGTVVATREAVTCSQSTDGCGRVVEIPRESLPGEGTFAQVEVRLHDGTLLRGAHPYPPIPPRDGEWSASLDRLDTWIHTTHGDEPRVVVTGDLNGGPAHPTFRRATSGLIAAPRAWPWQPTWPLGAPCPPFVQIDHVLSRGFAVADEGTWIALGTDHAGVWTRLRPLT